MAGAYPITGEKKKKKSETIWGRRLQGLWRMEWGKKQGVITIGLVLSATPSKVNIE